MRIHSLTTRFLLTLLLSTALPFLAFGWYARTEMEGRLESQVVRVFLPDSARQAASELEAQLDRIDQATGMLYNEALRVLREGGDPYEFGRFLDLTKGFDPDLVLLVDGDGKIVHRRLHPRLDKKTGAVREALLDSIEDVSMTPWFRHIADEQGEYWQGRHISPFLHATTDVDSRDPRDYSFAQALLVPTLTPGKRGAVYALMPWSEVQEVVDDTAVFLQEKAGFGSAEVFVCDRHGRFLAHSQREQYVGGRLPPELVRLLPAPFEPPVQAAFTGELGDALRAGIAWVEAGPLDWWVGLHAREDELLATSRELSAVLLVVTGATALILVVWSMFASRAILRPVRRLADATQEVARGDLDARVPARGRDEISDLGRAFNRMAADLAQRTEQLRHVERQAAWAEMARQVAHEIKNPLTPMQMSAQLLLRAKRDGDPRLPELTDRLARTVLDQTQALARIASEFRQFAGPPRLTLERVPARELLEDVGEHFGSMMDPGGVELVMHETENDLAVSVDRSELQRVFLNLLHNAVAACGARGRVRLSVTREGGSAVFRVEDDGVGIDAEARSKLFDPYFTTKSSGTGLGLAISRRIVEAHGGRIALEDSRPGRTVFRFELPAA